MALPLKTREIHSHHFDSTKWNGFCFRHDDIVVASGLKSGTVWTEYIIYRLLYQKNDEIPLDWMADVIWVDCRMPPIRVDGPILESISNRRSLLTHLPLDALVFSPMIKYIYIARDGRDVCFSLFNHYNNLSEKFYVMINEPEGTLLLASVMSNSCLTTVSSVLLVHTSRRILQGLSVNLYLNVNMQMRVHFLMIGLVRGGQVLKEKQTVILLGRSSTD